MTPLLSIYLYRQHICTLIARWKRFGVCACVCARVCVCARARGGGEGHDARQ